MRTFAEWLDVVGVLSMAANLGGRRLVDQQRTRLLGEGKHNPRENTV